MSKPERSRPTEVEVQSETRTSAEGGPSPKTPSEHDESTNSTANEPSPHMQVAREDVESGKVPTDKSEETDQVYDKLRGQVPGSERDG